MSRQLASAIDIDARPAQVWQVLTDLGAYAEWNPFIVHAKGQGAGRFPAHPPHAAGRVEERTTSLRS